MEIKTKCRMMELCKKHDVVGMCDKHCHFNTVRVKTNYDLLIRKTPEELAEWIADIADHGGGRCAPGCYDCTKRTCEEGWLGWLKQEVACDNELS